MARLTEIGVGGFKSIRVLQPLKMRPVNVFIGANGAGKSNLISFLQLLEAVGGGKLQEFVAREGGANALLYCGVKQTPAMWVRLKGYIQDNRRLRRDAGNLAAFLHALRARKPPYYRRIVDTIRLIAPFFDDFDLGPEPSNPNTILLNWKDRDTAYLFGPHQLSDGTLRAMALVTLRCFLNSERLRPSDRTGGHTVCQPG